MKHELLVPAGDMESLYQAIHNGADAVYVGLKNFNARHFAKNFDEQELVEAVHLCHLYNVRLYVTMNTVIKDDEVNLFLEKVEFLYKQGIDAIIMQDFGMICLVRQMYPNLEIHVSTQTNSSSVESIELLHQLGVKRVVLPRELSLDEIKKINVDIEKEVFIHGALCISYSGNCYMSAMLGKRSGNRGECVGNCRLKYSLKQGNKLLIKDKYLLSTKELNTSSNFNELLESNIDSFKIEGRMKSPEYVGFITSFYRKLIDHEKFCLDEELYKLKVLFNREFSKGHLFKANNILNTASANHQGIEIGQVIKVTPKKITIRLKHELNQEDGIRFFESGKGFIVNYLYDINGKLVSNTKDICIVDNKINLTTKDRVFKTIDKKLISSLQKVSEKKIPINMHLTALKNHKLKLTITDLTSEIIVTFGIVEEARTTCTSEEKIIKQLAKLGNTPFYLKGITTNLDNDIFISIKDLNEIRRLAVTQLIEKRTENKVNFLKKNPLFPKLVTNSHKYLTGTVMTEEQLITCLKLGFKRIYVNDIDLYQKYKYLDEIIYKLDRNEFIITKKLQEKNIIGENILFNKYKNIYGDYFLNITNYYSAYYLLMNGLNVIPVSVELNEEEINKMYYNFKDKFSSEVPLEVLVYGRVCNMTIKGNILNLENNKAYYLVDSKKNQFPVFHKNNCTYILNSEIKMHKYKLDFNYVKRFDFYDETKDQIINIVNKLK